MNRHIAFAVQMNFIYDFVKKYPEIDLADLGMLARQLEKAEELRVDVKVNKNPKVAFCEAYGVDPNSVTGFKCEDGAVTFTVVPTLVKPDADDVAELYARYEAAVEAINNVV